MKARRVVALVASAIAAFALAACSGGTPNTPDGSVVGSPGSGGTPGSGHKVNATVTIALDTAAHAPAGAHYLSAHTESVAVQAVAVDGNAVTSLRGTTINVTDRASHCHASGSQLTCTGTVAAIVGKDTFNVTAFAWPDATGAVLSSGQTVASIASKGSIVSIDAGTPLDGIIATLAMDLSPSKAKGGRPVNAQIRLRAFDASGAEIDGASPFVNPVTVSVQGDTANAFTLRSGSQHGASLTFDRPPSNPVLAYNGNKQASSVTLLASTDGAAVAASSATATFTLGNQPPPPNAQAIYVLNRGAKGGLGATVTVYAPTASGNAAPQYTLNLDPKLYAQSIAVDATQRVYIGYFDSALGVSPATGVPDGGNLVAIFAPNASGNATPQATITADTASNTTLFPAELVVQASGDLVTFGTTNVDSNQGDGTVLIYAAGATGATAPANAWNFGSPHVAFPGPTGLALDATGNFYLNGALKTSLGPQNGVYVAAAKDIGNPSATPARVIPWDGTTGLVPGQVNNIGLDGSGDVYVANFVVPSSGSTCQAQVSVFAAGAAGGTTDIPPLRVATIQSFAPADPPCQNAADTTAFPAIAVFGAGVYAVDDFANALVVYPIGASGVVTPAQTIAGSATGLNIPIGIAVGAKPTTNSDRAAARPAKPHSLPNSSKG